MKEKGGEPRVGEGGQASEDPRVKGHSPGSLGWVGAGQGGLSPAFITLATVTG